MLKNLENPLRFDEVMVVSFWLTFLAHPVVRRVEHVYHINLISQLNNHKHSVINTA